MLHHALQRQVQQREEEKLREQEDEIRRTLESSNLVKQARLRMKMAAISQERKRGDVSKPVVGAWDLALNAGSPQRQQLRIDSASSVSQDGASPSQPRLLESRPSRSQAAASATSPAPPQSKKQRTGSCVAPGNDSIAPLSPLRATPANGPAAATVSNLSLQPTASSDAAAGGSAGVATDAAASTKPSNSRRRRLAVPDEDEDDDLPLSMFNPARAAAAVAAAPVPAAAPAAVPSFGAASAAEQAASADDVDMN